MSGIRQSKFKHVFGKPLKRDECYECIPITKLTHDSQFCSVNPKYLAIVTESAGGGAFIVIPIEKTGRFTQNLPLVAGHTATVLDIQWSPFDYDVIASGSEDCTVKIWRIPEGGIKDEPLREPVTTLVGHQRRVNIVIWHPTAKSILASSGGDNITHLWNVEENTPLMSFELPNLVSSLCFNECGSKLAVSCRDGLTRIVNARTGNTLVSGTCHEGKKPSQSVFLDGDRLFTTGFSKMSDRQLALWDTDNLEESLWKEDVDISNGVLFPFYDCDTQLIYICGKGDSTIRYFEYSPEDAMVYYLSRFDSNDPQRGFALMPKLGLNSQLNEIARIYKLHNKNWCEVIPFTVPRRSGLFQDDLYPDTAAPVPTVTADEWFSGKDAFPIKISIKDGKIDNSSSFLQPDIPLDTTRKTSDVISDRVESSNNENRQDKEIISLRNTVFKLTHKLNEAESRIAELEAQLQDYNSSVHSTCSSTSPGMDRY